MPQVWARLVDNWLLLVLNGSSDAATLRKLTRDADAIFHAARRRGTEH